MNCLDCNYQSLDPMSQLDPRDTLMELSNSFGIEDRPYQAKSKFKIGSERKLKVGLSPFKKVCVIFFTESTLKMMKILSYFILKAFFILKILKFLSWLFGHVKKIAWLDR